MMQMDQTAKLMSELLQYKSFKLVATDVGHIAFRIEVEGFTWEDWGHRTFDEAIYDAWLTLSVKIAVAREKEFLEKNYKP